MGIADLELWSQMPIWEDLLAVKLIPHVHFMRKIAKEQPSEKLHILIGLLLGC